VTTDKKKTAKPKAPRKVRPTRTIILAHRAEPPADVAERYHGPLFEQVAEAQEFADTRSAIDWIKANGEGGTTYSVARITRTATLAVQTIEQRSLSFDGER